MDLSGHSTTSAAENAVSESTDFRRRSMDVAVLKFLFAKSQVG